MLYYISYHSCTANKAQLPIQSYQFLSYKTRRNSMLIFDSESIVFI